MQTNIENKLLTEEKSTLKESLILALKLFLFGGIGFATFQAFLRSDHRLGQYVFDVFFNGTMWIVLWMGNGYVSDKLSNFISWVDQPMKRFVVSVLATIIFTLVAGFVIAAAYATIVYNVSVSLAIKRLGWNFAVSVTTITAIIALFLHGRQFLFALKASIKETEALKRENLSSRYETLKNQVNPHFLFNSLNVLSSLVYKDQDLAAKFIKQMSKVYRYVLDTKENEVVNLSTELDALHSYIFLLKIRFEENLKVNINLPDDDSIMMVPLSLQMLVENAIKHNIVSKAKPLTIDIYEEGDRIIVQNNLQVKSDVLDSSGIGLPNITARYQYLSKQEVMVVKDEVAASFKVSLPKVLFK